MKSQKWLTLTGSPAYQFFVPSFSYWIVFKYLAAIQFRSRGEWRNFPYLAILPTSLCRKCPEEFPEYKARNRVFVTRGLSIPNEFILLITVFHVAIALMQRRREKAMKLINRYLLSAMFLEGLWNVRNVESGIRNAEFAFFQVSAVRVFPFSLTENQFAR